jgi:hypothetical protein
LGTPDASSLFHVVEEGIIAFAITVPDGMIYPVSGTAVSGVIVIPDVRDAIVPITGADVVVTPVSLMTTWYVN